MFGLNKEFLVHLNLGQIKISNSIFEQNYSGQKGSAVNLQDIQSSTIELRSNIFYNNTGSFSFFEREHMLPFYEILAMRTQSLNYFAHVSEAACADEIASIGRPDCSSKRLKTAALNSLLPAPSPGAMA